MFLMAARRDGVEILVRVGSNKSAVEEEENETPAKAMEVEGQRMHFVGDDPPPAFALPAPKPKGDTVIRY